MDLKHLVSTFRLKTWVPFFKPKGERLTDALIGVGVNPADFINFYTQHGDTQLEFIEKIINERIKQDNFDNMTKIQAAYLGYNALLSFMKQLSVEKHAQYELEIMEQKKSKK